MIQGHDSCQARCAQGNGMKHPEWNKASGGCRRAALASYEPDRDTSVAPASSRLTLASQAAASRAEMRAGAALSRLEAGATQETLLAQFWSSLSPLLHP